MGNFEYVIKAEGHTFHLLLTEFNDRNTGNISSININLGGSHKKCLNLNISATESTGKLSWVERHEECSLEINNPQSQLLILLAISIAKSINPNIQYIYLDDTSHFQCTLPEGNERKIEMKPFHIAFHQSSWYEYYFNAHLVADHNKYVALKANFTNPQNKPVKFNFNNDTLQKELEPLYNSTNIWADFFKAISQKYGRKKCAIIYPWIKDALYILFENTSHFENMKWVIDLENNNKIKQIQFTTYKAEWSGGGKKNKTRKQQVKKHINKLEYLFLPHIISTWNYNKFLK